MKKIGVISIMMMLLGISPAFADLYQWTDKEGIVHITDDPARVPGEVKDRVKVFKTAPAERRPEAEEAAPAPVLKQPGGAELYGEQPLEWWSHTIKGKRDDIKAAEAAITAKRQYTDVFEGGRRFGQTFGAAEVETYSRYKKEIPEDEKNLTILKDELDELLRKAANAGVPKEARE